MVEMALVLPIVLVVVTALAEFSWIFWNFVAIHNACHSGARLGIIQETADNQAVIEETRQKMYGLPLSRVEISTRSQEGTEFTSEHRRFEDLLEVSAACDYGFLTPLPRLVPGLSGFNEIRGRAVLMMEQ